MKPACLLLASTLWSCQTQQAEFTEGRLEDLCAGAIPVCQLRAACVLEPDEFVRGQLPGAQRLIIRSDFDDMHAVVRILLEEQAYPGTELLLQAWSPGCGDLDQEQRLDVDLFALAGDDRILQFELALGEKGDHLLEFFSDMTAAYLLTVDVE